jgi:hypothetical protein
MPILRKELLKAHNPKLAELPGMVNQLWDDGEITCQKCGELLWQRNLHQLDFPIPAYRPNGDVWAGFPIFNKHSYIFASSEDCERIRKLMIANAIPDESYTKEVYARLQEHFSKLEAKEWILSWLEALCSNHLDCNAIQEAGRLVDSAHYVEDRFNS